MLRNTLGVALVAVSCGCAAPEKAEPLGPMSVPLERARAENPAPIAASEPDAGAVVTPSAAECPLSIAEVVVEAEGVPNGMSIVFRKRGEEARVRELTRRWFERLGGHADAGGTITLEGVRAELGYSDAPDGAMVTFVPEDLDFELDHIGAVSEAVRSTAEGMRRTRACPMDPERLLAAL